MAISFLAGTSWTPSLFSTTFNKKKSSSSSSGATTDDTYLSYLLLHSILLLAESAWIRKIISMTTRSHSRRVAPTSTTAATVTAATTTGHIVYYDVFNAEEEDEFLGLEAQRIAKEVDRFVQEMEQGRKNNVNSSSNHDGTVTGDEENATAAAAGLSYTLDFSLRPPQLKRIVDAVLVHNNTKKKTGQTPQTMLQSLSFRRWGLGNSGTPEVARLLLHDDSSSCSSLCELSLASCGLTSCGFKVVLEALSTAVTTNNNSSSSIRKLDLSRNNLRHDHSTVEALLRKHIPMLKPSLEELDLSFTGLRPLTVQALLEGLATAAADKRSRKQQQQQQQQQRVTTEAILHDEDFTSCCNLQQVDLSHNVDSLETLIDQSSLVDYLPKLEGSSLKRLILVRGTSSSTCLDYHSPKVATLLIQIAQNLQNNNHTLEVLGPFSLLPLDKSLTDPKVLQRHVQCMVALKSIDFALRINPYRPTLQRIIKTERMSWLPHVLDTVGLGRRRCTVAERVGGARSSSKSSPRCPGGGESTTTSNNVALTKGMESSYFSTTYQSQAGATVMAASLTYRMLRETVGMLSDSSVAAVHDEQGDTSILLEKNR